jgi:hypothetical protein
MTADTHTESSELPTAKVRATYFCDDALPSDEIIKLSIRAANDLDEFIFVEIAPHQSINLAAAVSLGIVGKREASELRAPHVEKWVQERGAFQK